ncbi:hypothetical protein PR048_001249 [Dryococelus australis]|uniref:Uncharacterized protein n=1 Tax=Dryococelus australis TaxID=614101 RepID=A0ABQ9IGT8_9NEOP|nr:hypothetical protein PR048_001249 [Dryococelus australis]
MCGHCSGGSCMNIKIQDFHGSDDDDDPEKATQSMSVKHCIQTRTLDVASYTGLHEMTRQTSSGTETPYAVCNGSLTARLRVVGMHAVSLSCTVVTGSCCVHRECTVVSERQLTLQHFTTQYWPQEDVNDSIHSVIEDIGDAGRHFNIPLYRSNNVNYRSRGIAGGIAFGNDVTAGAARPDLIITSVPAVPRRSEERNFRLAPNAIFYLFRQVSRCAATPPTPPPPPLSIPHSTNAGSFDYRLASPAHPHAPPPPPPSVDKQQPFLAPAHFRPRRPGVPCKLALRGCLLQPVQAQARRRSELGKGVSTCAVSLSSSLTAKSPGLQLYWRWAEDGRQNLPCDEAAITHIVTPLESRRATSCDYNSSHPVWDALYECLQDIYGDSSPFILQPFHELSNGFWPRLTSPHPEIQFVRKMFYKVEVGL